eukprot:CAMPEP_0175933328 /NCGR_PEP_ID=MMETSP0108-20121206/19867_1 /TAXON_ID=195067 ORGANISM="Goniomonas pacifica, Strain CCMP1869" /NCGR_SAMPLE_ID=MMETSP0108 /ASSEMBLY_ACC=CAM_ASM_000204 /LENGTH=57 /DNA_ID=CAMNT_0017257031 /DNA_START=80 /DNA_END=250 /DNA_ORIENTATION=+
MGGLLFLVVELGDAPRRPFRDVLAHPDLLVLAAGPLLDDPLLDDLDAGLGLGVDGVD